MTKEEKADEECNLLKHARREFKVLGWDVTDDGMQRVICTGVLDLLRVFSDQGHSGSSAPYMLDLFEKLASFEPLAPLTGADDEWNDTGGGVLQNKRCSHVFKEGDRVYDIEGFIFREPDGNCYTNGESHVDVVFPYVPERVYIDVNNPEEDSPYTDEERKLSAELMKQARYNTKDDSLAGWIRVIRKEERKKAITEG